jgi:hypothetical protein
MANEFQHKDPGSELTQAEYITTDGTGHIFDCQATGDIMYASSATVLKNLGKGAANTILSMGGSCIPAWTASPTIGSTSWANANHAHAASNSGGTLTTVGALDAGSITSGFGTIDTGASAITTTGAITGGSLVADNFTLNGTELDLSTGDFALDVAGDIEVNADGGCINFKDASLALAAIVNTSCVGELRLHEAANYIGLKPPALSANQTWTWPATAACCACDVLTCNGSGVLSWATAGGGVVSGGTDNAILRADGTGGSTSQGSGAILTDANVIQAGNGCATTPTYSFTSNTNLGMYRAGTDLLNFATGGTERIRLKDAQFFLGETANCNVNTAITINQACRDNEIFALKSSDVAHGVTTTTHGSETDTYFIIKKQNGCAGGAVLTGLGEGAYGLYLKGIATTDCTTHSANGAGNGVFNAFKADGTGVQAHATDANLFVVAVNNLTRFIVDNEGDLFADGSAATVYDSYCDAQLARTLTQVIDSSGGSGMINNHWDDFIRYNEQTLIDLDLLGAPRIGIDPSEVGLINYTGMVRLHSGAIWQLHSKLNDQQEEILALKGQFHALTEGE